MTSLMTRLPKPSFPRDRLWESLVGYQPLLRVIPWGPGSSLVRRIPARGWEELRSMEGTSASLHPVIRDPNGDFLG
jgi:hypothetical protein